MTIRLATLDDIESIKPMWIGLVEYHSQLSVMFRTTPGFRERISGNIRKMLEKPDTRFFLAEDNGQVIGYVIASISERPSVFEYSRKGQIGDTFVYDEHRSKGAGKALVDAAKEWLLSEKVDFIDLQVTASNEAGVRFWKRQGFDIANHLMIYDARRDHLK